MSSRLFRIRYTRLKLVLSAGLLVLAGIGAGVCTRNVFSVNAQSLASPIFRPGEKLSYNISFGKFPNAAFAETQVVSKGKLSGVDAVELRGRLRTLELVNAAFFFLDEQRVTYAVPETGLPLYITNDSHNSVLPKERITSYLTEPATSYDLLTLLFKVRESAGAGTFTVTEGGQVHTISITPGAAERVKTDAGDFDTTVSTVQSDFLVSRGMKDFRINLSTDPAHVPVQFRFKTSKGEVKAILSGMSLPEAVPSATPLPSPTPMPKPSGSPGVRPTPVPPVYVDNVPLAPELGFQLGEELEFNITSAGKDLARMLLMVKGRRLVEGQDTLILSAVITSVMPGVQEFRVNDQGQAQVDPETLTPRRSSMRFASILPGLKQELVFDRRTGNVTYGGKAPEDAPIGTHSVLSLLYAMRSFNLRPSKDLSSPVNDTRVAVFWDTKAHIFVLRPSAPEFITLNGEKVSAQLVRLTTTNLQLDLLSPKVWLDTDDRTPVRFTAGTYQADLIARRNFLNR